MKLFITLFISFLAAISNAQYLHGEKMASTINCHNISSFAIDNKAVEKEVVYDKNQSLQLSKNAPFIAFSARWQEDSLVSKTNSQLFVRFSADNKNWNEWQALELFHEADNIYHQSVSKLYFTDVQHQYYQLKVITNKLKLGRSINNIYVNFFAPNTEKNTQIQTNNEFQPVVFGGTSCPCPIPNFTNRVQWGNPQGATSAVTSTTTVSHMIVHHSDGSNTSSNWAATVKAIYDFHTGTNGWSDIGYNWLIAPDGTLFEGRGRTNATVLGAHFCGFNANTMGVCMLGNYTATDISTAARNTLRGLLGWMDCNANLNTVGTAFHASSNRTLNIISGHRDGCATTCPGDRIYNVLASLRTDVNNYVNNGCGVTAIVNIEGVKHISIHPNPVKKAQHIVLSVQTTVPKSMQYTIVNLLGKEIYTSPVKRIMGMYKQPIMEQVHLPAGTYSIKIYIDKEYTTQNFVVL